MAMRKRGFTLIELLVVMAIVATLLSIVAPRYFRHLDRAKETALHQTLNVVRDSIDKYYADKGKYPATLDELVEQHYLRQVPVDPITESKDGWTLLPPPDNPEGGVWDLHSSAGGSDEAGVPYQDY
jgi:general secretion pathway protein G